MPTYDVPIKVEFEPAMLARMQRRLARAGFTPEHSAGVLRTLAAQATAADMADPGSFEKIVAFYCEAVRRLSSREVIGSLNLGDPLTLNVRIVFDCDFEGGA